MGDFSPTLTPTLFDEAGEVLPGSAGPLSTGLLSSNSSRPGTGITEVAFGGCGCPQSVEFQEAIKFIKMNACI